MIFTQLLMPTSYYHQLALHIYIAVGSQIFNHKAELFDRKIFDAFIKSHTLIIIHFRQTVVQVTNYWIRELQLIIN